VKKIQIDSSEESIHLHVCTLTSPTRQLLHAYETHLEVDRRWGVSRLNADHTGLHLRRRTKVILSHL